MLNFFKSLFCKHESVYFEYEAKGRYKANGSVKGYKLRYDIYRVSVCRNCGERLNSMKVASNVKEPNLNVVLRKFNFNDGVSGYAK